MEISCWPSQPINEAIAALMTQGVLCADDAARILGVTAIRTYGDLCTFAARGELETVGMEPLAMMNLCDALGIGEVAVYSPVEPPTEEDRKYWQWHGDRLVRADPPVPAEDTPKRGGKRKGDGA